MSSGSANWEKAPLKFVSSINRLALPDSTPGDQRIRYIDISSVNSLGEIVNIDPMTFGSAPSRARRIVRHGDTVVSTVRTYLRAVARIPKDDQDLVASTGFAVVTPSPGLHAGFVSYWLRSNPFIDEVCARSVGVSYPAINSGEIGCIAVPMPPPLTQEAIADFLDKKTEAIDKLIAAKQKLLELLAEKRAALINQAVTKGLDPTVPMKDSGIEWIGEIPAHWEVTRVGNLAEVVRGGSPRPAGDPRFFNGDDLPWITVGEVTNASGMFVVSTATRLTREGVNASRVVEEGTLLLSNSGATLGVPKFTAIRGCINDGSVAFPQLRSSLRAEYLYWYYAASTDRLRGELKQGMGQPNLNTDMIRSERIPLPPVGEQSQIHLRLKREQKGWSEFEACLFRTVTRLQEYRQALITAAVTGQLDIEEAA